MLGSAEDCVGVLDESDYRVTAAQCADADTDGESNCSCGWRSSVAECTMATAYHSMRAFSSAWRNEAVGEIMTNSSPVTRQEVVFTDERRTLLSQGNQDATTDGMAMRVVDLLTISDVQQEKRKRG